MYVSSLAFLPLSPAQVTNITPGPVFGGQVSGIDSSLVCALWNEYHDHTINSISFTNSDRPLTRPGAQLTEPAAIEHVSRVLETNHQFVDLADEREGFKLHTRQYARSCFDGIGSSVEYQFFVKQVQGLGFERIITGFNNDGLMGDLPGHDYLTRVLHRKFPQYYRFKIAEMLLERRIIRGAIARLNPSFLQHNEPYAYYGMIETISGNPMLLAQGIDREYLRAANYEYMLPPEELLDQFQDYSAIQHFILADITRIGMGTFQRFNKACTYYDVSWWSPYWDIDVMETALAIPIDYRNKEFSKYIARQLVSDRVSPQIAWLGKSGFARNVINEFFDEWEVYEEIIEGGVLDILPLEGGRRQRLANQIMTKSRSLKKAYWPLYWMTKTIENLKSMIG